MKPQWVWGALALAILSGSIRAEEQQAPELESREQVEAAQEQQSTFAQRGEALLQASPQEILKMREHIQNISAAKQAPIMHDFEPDVPQDVLDIEEMFELTLGPDAKAPEIFISRYQGSAVSFVDAYGNPWPITKISSFLSGLVQIDKALPDEQQAAPVAGGSQQQAKEGAGLDIHNPQAGGFTITALKHGVVGNLTVYLHGLASPVSLKLIGKPAMYHRMVTIKVQDVGPQTNRDAVMAQSGVVVGTETDVDLNNALYGVSPSGSETMVVEGGEGKAWVKGQEIYLQTPLAVFSPQILRASAGNGRYKAYRIPATTTVLATNNEGRTVELKIKRHPATAIYNESQRGVN